MQARHRPRLRRRTFLSRSLAAGAAAVAATTLGVRRLYGADPAGLSAGEGVVDTTPPLKIELGGFHRPPGQERRVEGIRQPTAARALVLKVGETTAAVVSLDINAVVFDMSERVRERVERETGIPAGHVRLCATHTHAMPSFHPLRQWGAVSHEYMRAVEDKVVEAVRLAKQDLAPAELHVGTARAKDANFNRTQREKAKTDEQFTKEATDDERWLDTTLHALRFVRGRADGDGARKPDLLWYHFSAHPVCYQDGLAGPDWPGLVAAKLRESHGLEASYLQGHAGDVNPGPGDPWIGLPEPAADAVHAALKAAVDNAKPVRADSLSVAAAECEVPFDVDRLKADLARYEADPAGCAAGEWVDPGFAKAWYDAASQYDLNRAHLPAPMTAMRLGEVGWLFHPAELFSYYGLRLRTGSPLPHTLVVGYTDTIIGYLADPNAYKAALYEATVVPKILDLPPFAPEAARAFTTQAADLAAMSFS